VDGGVLCVGFWVLCCYEGYEGWVEDWRFLLIIVEGVGGGASVSLSFFWETHGRRCQRDQLFLCGVVSSSRA
jgi:hypothetical protein